MKYNIHFLATIYFLIATSSCIAMKKELNILAELPTAPNEKFAAFISSYNILINGKKSCRIVDFETGDTIKTIDCMPPNGIITLSPNREHFACSNKKDILVYNTKTITKEWALPFDMDLGTPACMLNSSDGTIFWWEKHNCLGMQLQRYDCGEDLLRPTTISVWGEQDPLLIDMHPTKQQMCFLDHLSGERNEPKYGICIYNYDEEKKYYIRTKILGYYSLKYFFDLLCIKYSPNGAHIAIVRRKEIEIISSDKNITSAHYKVASQNNDIASIEFHPNGTALAVLLVAPQTKSVTLQYLDSNKANVIAEISLSDFFPSCVVDEAYSALSFSPSGTTMMIKFCDKCIVLSVPLEVIYESKEAQDKALLI